MVFDREGHGSEFFYGLVQDGIAFVTWEKYADAAELAAIDDERFKQVFKFNDKWYGIFEERKAFVYRPIDPETNKPDKGKEQEYALRRIFIWNKTSNRRVSGFGLG